MSMSALLHSAHIYAAMDNATSVVMPRAVVKDMAPGARDAALMPRCYYERVVMIAPRYYCRTAVDNGAVSVALYAKKMRGA